MNENNSPPAPESQTENELRDDIAQAIVRKNGSDFARLRTAETDLPDETDNVAVVRHTGPNFARVRTASRDIQDSFDAPVVRKAGSDMARMRTETVDPLETSSCAPDPFLRAIPVASKPSKPHP